MQNFTPYSALLGGAIIGISIVLLLFLTGRIAGISGIAHGVVPFHKKESVWRILFIVGLILGGLTYYLLPQIHFTFRSGYSVTLLITSGFLVGIGTKMSGGCTSGHGVCGIARISLRSFVATGVFILFGIMTVFVVRHWWALS